MAVYFKCKICGGEHAAPPAVFGTRAALDASTGNKRLRCPFSGQSAEYGKTELKWRDELPA
ncbi:MAG: hypothetical protein M3081_19675 [Gemmatimonadota bacterium]|nr:hypothetical protein [Gemmatimonadota bacterium]